MFSELESTGIGTIYTYHTLDKRRKNANEFALFIIYNDPCATYICQNMYKQILSTEFLVTFSLGELSR